MTESHPIQSSPSEVLHHSATATLAPAGVASEQGQHGSTSAPNQSVTTSKPSQPDATRQPSPPRATSALVQDSGAIGPGQVRTSHGPTVANTTTYPTHSAVVTPELSEPGTASQQMSSPSTTKLGQLPTITELTTTTKLVQHGGSSSGPVLQPTTSSPGPVLEDVMPSDGPKERVDVTCPFPVWPGSSPFSISEASGMLLAGEERLFVWKFQPRKVRKICIYDREMIRKVQCMRCGQLHGVVSGVA